ncbi:hypothetical protein AUP68_14971 [Ilyonectria robusta]
MPPSSPAPMLLKGDSRIVGDCGGQAQAREPERGPGKVNSHRSLLIHLPRRHPDGSSSSLRSTAAPRCNHPRSNSPMRLVSSHEATLEWVQVACLPTLAASSHSHLPGCPLGKHPGCSTIGQSKVPMLGSFGHVLGQGLVALIMPLQCGRTTVT